MTRGSAWPAGQPRSLSYPDVGVGAIPAGSAMRYPDRVALRDGTQSLTFAELYDRCLRVAQGLRERGVSRGDVVALLVPNSLWFPVGYYGVLLAGAAVAPMNPLLPPAALRDQLASCGASAAIAHPICAAQVAAASVEALRFVVVVPPSAAAPGEIPVRVGVRLDDLCDADAAPPTQVGPDDIAHLSFTGGTTGRSKAVRLLHRNVMANTLQAACWRYGAAPELDAVRGLGIVGLPAAATHGALRVGRETAISVAPLFHAMGLVAQNSHVLAGATTLLFGRFDPDRYLAEVEQHGVAQVAGAPPMHRALLTATTLAERDLTCVRIVTSGAAPLDQATMRRLGEVFPNAVVVQGYGLTESTMTLTLAPPDRDNPTPPGSVGLPIFDTEVQIRDLAEGDRVLAPGETGEVWARGPQVAAGYLDDADLTARQFVDGWLRTGDVGFLDDHGFLHIAGRAKDMLLYKGYNVYPLHLEELLATHPAVAQVAVVGAADADAGEIPVAFVVLREGETSGAQELMGYVAERVAPYQRVRDVRFVDALPVSAAGKVLKTELRAALAG